MLSVSNGMKIRLKSEKDIGELRLSGAILAAVLQALKEKAGVGVRLSELDDLARKLIEKAGAKPAFLHYKPEGAKHAYPASICASVNEVVVHGLPGRYALKSGDVLKIDLGVVCRGYVTDAALTVAVGPVPEMVQQLMSVTEKSLALAVKECLSGNHLGDVGWAIENCVERNGFSLIKGLTGHGTGFELHEDPTVYNYGQKGTGMALKAGLVLAIEPMVAIGSGEVRRNPDESFATRDKSFTAHFEHTVAITKRGPEILTLI